MLPRWIQDADFVQLMLGKLNPQQAFMKGTVIYQLFVIAEASNVPEIDDPFF